MAEFNPGAQVVALVTAVRAGLDAGDVVRMLDDAVREGTASDREVISRLAEVVGMFTMVTAFICERWDQADGTAAATRYMAELGKVAATQGKS